MKKITRDNENLDLQAPWQNCLFDALLNREDDIIILSIECRKHSRTRKYMKSLQVRLVKF